MRSRLFRLAVIAVAMAGNWSERTAAQEAGDVADSDFDNLEIARALDAYTLSWQLSGGAKRHSGLGDGSHHDARPYRRVTFRRRWSPRPVPGWHQGQWPPYAVLLVEGGFKSAERPIGVSIDGQVQKTIGGQVDWNQLTYEIPNGEHQIAWVYQKDNSADSDGDVAWIDEVGLSVSSPPKVEIVPPQNTQDRWIIRSSVVPHRFYRLWASDEKDKPRPVSMASRVTKVVVFEELPSYAEKRKDTYRIEMVEPPSFRELPPATKDGVVGQPFDLPSDAEGSGDMTYQWFHQPKGKE